VPAVPDPSDLLHAAPASVLIAGARLARARSSFAEFVRQAWPEVRPGDPLRWGWHLDAICLHLEAVARGQIRKLLITVCPGSAKSLLTEVFWPAWLWAIDPSKQLVCLASDGDLALRDANRNRDLIRSEWYQSSFARAAGWTFSASQDAKGYFENTAKGFRYSAGVSGSVTGWRGHGVIMDDLLQAKDVLSKPARDAAVYALDNIIPSRVNDPAVGFFLMIQQRLCVDDPASWAIAQGDYEHLNLPTEFDSNRRCVTHGKGGRVLWRDPRQTDGELLFPQLFTPEVIAAAKRSPEAYAAQHQQDPMPPGGGMFKVADWRFWRAPDEDRPQPRRDQSWHQGAARILPVMDEKIVSCDATFKKTKSGSRVAIHVWGKRGADRYLIERVWDRMDFAETERALLGVFERHPDARTKIIEDKANGSGLITRLRDVHGISGIVEGKTGDGDKEQRANAMLPYQRGGNVYLPDHAPWVGDYILEHALFPAPCHLGNDDVDCQSQAFAHWESTPSTADLWRQLAEEQRRRTAR
jgi:predicted phage terminase large subunit-like protein